MLAKNFLKEAFFLDTSKTVKEALLLMVKNKKKAAFIIENNIFIGIVDYNELLLKYKSYTNDTVKGHLLREYVFFNEEANEHHIYDILSYKKQYEYPILSDGNVIGTLDIPKFIKYYTSKY